LSGRPPTHKRSPTEQALVADERLTAVGLLMETASSLANALSCHIVEHGVSPSEFEVLLRLSRSPDSGLRMADLAAQAGISASGLTRLMDRLEQRRLVTRLTCSTDRRGLTAVLTPAGRKLVLKILPGHIADIDQWYTGALDADQLTSLDRALRAVRRRVRPGAEAGADGPG
jgi:DNA-binding MarR family transcriptional regulator